MMRRGVFGLLLLLAPLTAAALAGPKAVTDDWRIPYDGYLEVDGVAQGAPLALRFTLYDAAGQEAWSEEWSDEETRSCAALPGCLIPTQRGRFSAALGRYTRLTSAIRDAEALWLGIAVRGVDDAWIVLSNRQRLAPAAWALVTDTAGALTARGSVTTTGDAVTRGGLTGASLSGASAVVGMQLSAASLRSGGTVSVEGEVSVSGGVQASGPAVIRGQALRFGAGSGNGAGGRALSRDATDTLRINPDGDFVRTDFASLHANAVTIEAGGLLPGRTQMGATWAIPSMSGWNVPPFIATHSVYVGTAGSAEVCADCVNTYDLCWVAGFDFGLGDINEGGSATIMQLYTYKSGSSWRVFSDFASTNVHEPSTVRVMCARSELTQVISTFN